MGILLGKEGFNLDVSSREFEFTLNDFEHICSILYKEAGIKLNESKGALVYSRLARRLRLLGITRFSDYLSFLKNNSDELEQFINSLTTNLTSFFREKHHFEVLHQYFQGARGEQRIWCAASSTGEEVYSIAITAALAYESLFPPVKILATDIDSHVLLKARQGVYAQDRVTSLKFEDKKRFFHKGTGANEGNVRLIPEIRKLITFKKLNLIDDDWSLVPSTLDIIFCRNVMISFDASTQNRLLERFSSRLTLGGLYFAGHSETVTDFKGNLRLAGKTVYRKLGMELNP